MQGHCCFHLALCNLRLVKDVAGGANEPLVRLARQAAPPRPGVCSNGATLQEMVVRREQVAVLTRGTLTDPEMRGAHPDAVFLMSVAELPVPSSYAAAGTALWYQGTGVKSLGLTRVRSY